MARKLGCGCKWPTTSRRPASTNARLKSNGLCGELEEQRLRSKAGAAKRYRAPCITGIRVRRRRFKIGEDQIAGCFGVARTVNLRNGRDGRRTPTLSSRSPPRHFEQFSRLDLQDRGELGDDFQTRIAHPFFWFIPVSSAAKRKRDRNSSRCSALR